MKIEQENVISGKSNKVVIGFHNLPYGHIIDTEFLAENYWKHLNRLHGSDGKTRFLPYIGVAAGLINGGSSLAKGIMGLKGDSSHSGRFLDVKINNFSDNSLVLYKIEDAGVSQVRGVIVPADGSGNVSIIGCNFKRDDGPKLHFCMDYGSGTASFIVQLGSTTNDNTSGSGQIRIRQVISEGITCEDENGSSNQRNTELNTPMFRYEKFKDGTVIPFTFMIVCPPVSDSSADLNITFLSSDPIL